MNPCDPIQVLKLPLTLSIGSREGRLKREQQEGIAIGSAGFMIAFATFTFL